MKRAFDNAHATNTGEDEIPDPEPVHSSGNESLSESKCKELADAFLFFLETGKEPPGEEVFSIESSSQHSATDHESSFENDDEDVERIFEWISYEISLEEKVDKHLQLYPGISREKLKTMLRNAIRKSKQESKGGRGPYMCRPCDVPLKGHKKYCPYRKASEKAKAPKNMNKHLPRLKDEDGNLLNRCGFCQERKVCPDGSDHTIICKFCHYCGQLKSDCIQIGTCSWGETWNKCRQKWTA